MSGSEKWADEILNDVKSQLKEELQHERFEIDCPSCKNRIRLKPGLGVCPICGEKINLKLDAFDLES